MSETITPAAEWVELSLPNDSISPDKWHFGQNEQDGLTKLIQALIPFGALVVVFFLSSRFGPWNLLDESFTHSDAGGFTWCAFFVLSLIGSLFLANRIAKRAVISRERKRDEYRAQHASTLIDSLSQQGWTIFGQNAVETIIKDNNPYMFDNNGVRYYARQLYIGRTDIILMLALSDPEVEKIAEETKKQQRIEFEVNRHEEANGNMTPEEKAAFVAALTIVL